MEVIRDAELATSESSVTGFITVKLSTSQVWSPLLLWLVSMDPGEPPLATADKEAQTLAGKKHGGNCSLWLKAL
eukprot:2460357-Amphidinium_carterae.1